MQLTSGVLIKLYEVIRQTNYIKICNLYSYYGATPIYFLL